MLDSSCNPQWCPEYMWWVRSLGHIKNKNYAPCKLTDKNQNATVWCFLARQQDLPLSLQQRIPKCTSFPRFFTFGEILELFAGSLLAPLPGLEDLAQGGELAFLLQLGSRGAPHHHITVRQGSFFQSINCKWTDSEWLIKEKKEEKKKINNNNNNVGGAMTQPGDKTVTSLQAIKIIIRCNWLGRHGQKWKKRNRWS